MSSYVFLDGFAQPPNLYIGGHSSHKTVFGMVFTIFFGIFIILLFSLFLYWYSSSYWLTLTINPVYKTYPEITWELNFSETKSFEWSLNKTNFLPYFTIFREIENDRIEVYEQLKKYVEIEFFTFDKNEKESRLNFKNCSDDEILHYLKLNDSYSYNNKYGPRICIDGTVTVGVHQSDETKTYPVSLSGFGLKIKKCDPNKTNISCATQTEFNEVVENIIFETYIPENYYSEDPYKEGKKRAIDYEKHKLDNDGKKEVITKISKHDYYWNDDIIQGESDFTQETTATDYNNEKELNNTLLEYRFIMGHITFEHKKNGREFLFVFSRFFSVAGSVLTGFLIVVFIHHHFSIERDLIHSM